MKSNIHNNKTQSGFTLAELLIATALLSIVLGSLYTMTQTTLVAWRTLDHGADPFAEARNATSIFRHEFENLINDGGTVFEGSDSEITLLVLSDPLDIADAQGIHMMRVRYYLERTRGKTMVLMREEELAKGAVSSEENASSRLSTTRGLQYKPGKKFQVASNLSDFKIRYIWIPTGGSRAQDQPPSQPAPIFKNVHRKNWGFPQAVEITYTVVDPEDRREPLSVRTTFPVRHSSSRKSGAALTRLE